MTRARDLANAGPAFASVNATELGYLDGVTSAIQTQLNGKEPLLPSQTGNAGKYLTTDGTNDSWGTISAGGITQLATSTPTGVNTITFSSIPSTYQNLQLMFYGVKSTGGDELIVRVNGITGANCYSFSKVSNSTASFQNNTFMTLGDTAGGTNSRSGSAIFWNYANATASGKEMSYWSNRLSIGSGLGLADFGHGMAIGTTANGAQGVGTISSITLSQTNNFQSGTNFVLYGVK